MPPKATSSSIEVVTEEWEQDKSGFFNDFSCDDQSGQGKSSRKRAREAAEREAKTGKTLEQEALDPVVSANEARKKIGDIVRARAGVSNGNRADSSGRSSTPAQGKVNAKFERKEQRAEEAAENSIKFKRLLAKQPTHQYGKRR